MAQDPICGMQVKPKESIRVRKDGQDYFFCSSHCKDTFISQEGLSESCVSWSSSKKAFYKNKLFLITCFILLLLAASFILPSLVAFRRSFLSYLKVIWWAVTLGLLLGGVVDYYVPREYISKILSRKRPSAIFNAVFLGFLMSACSHGILALSIQLHKKGASNPAVVAFLLASPWANLSITVMLFAFFGAKGLFIVIAAILVALNTGFVFMWLEKKGLIEKNKNSIEVHESFSILADVKLRLENYHLRKDTFLKDLKGVFSGALALADMVLWWLLLGMLIASLAGAYIPVHFFHKFMGPSLAGLLVTLALASVIEVCSEGSSPLAFEIYRQTGALGNSFVFLMAGVATDYTEIGLLWANVGRRTALWLPIVAVPQIVALGILANSIFH